MCFQLQIHPFSSSSSSVSGLSCFKKRFFRYPLDTFLSIKNSKRSFLTSTNWTHFTRCPSSVPRDRDATTQCRPQSPPAPCPATWRDSGRSDRPRRSPDDLRDPTQCTLCCCFRLQITERMDKVRLETRGTAT